MHIYGMSKMTNTREAKEIDKQKNVNNVTELLEMIARAGELKNLEENDLTLNEKIITILDIVLGLIGAKTVVPVILEMED